MIKNVYCASCKILVILEWSSSRCVPEVIKTLNDQSTQLMFYRNHTTCIGLCDPSSGAYRLEIYRQFQLILLRFNLNIYGIPHHKINVTVDL